MATITVTNLNDSGAGSLRQAIGNANPNDTIDFAPNLAGGTLVLTNGQLDINKILTIDGITNADGTPDITIDAGGNSRVFQFGNAITATLNGLVIENGHVADNGGGIAVGAYDALTVTNSRLTGNSASYGDFNHKGEGGAIAVAQHGSLTLLNTTVDHNTAESGGGGIYEAVFANVNIVNSALLGNDTGNANGGAADVFESSLTLINTTVSGNAAYGGGGIAGFDPTIKLYDSTLTGNLARHAEFGAIQTNTALLTLSNSIVAGNYGHGGDDIRNDSGTIYFKGYSILGSAPTAPGGSIDKTQGSYTTINGRDATALKTVFASVGNNPDTNVLSGVVTSNGGPVKTAAIAFNGIARDAGVNAALPPDSFDLNHNLNTAEPLPVDARGLPRVYGSHVDIGAFESQLSALPANLVVTTLADETYDGGNLAAETADGAGLSLREALGLINAAGATGTTITFAPNLVGGTIHLTNGELDIIADGTKIEGDIDGNGRPDIAIDAGGNSRVFNVDGGLGSPAVAATLDGLVMVNGYVGTGNGGGIAVGQYDALTVTNSRLAGNGAAAAFAGAFHQGEGGAIYVGYKGALTLLNSTIDHNDAVTGGGISTGKYAGLTLTNATVSSNDSHGAGGGIDLGLAATGTLTNATIAGNNSAANGGGIYGYEFNPIKLYNSTITGNYAASKGGGIFNFGNLGASVTLANSIVAGNAAAVSANDLDLDNTPLVLKGHNILGSTPANASSIDTSNGNATQIDGTNPADLASVFARVAQNPHGVLSGVLADNGGAVRTVAINPAGIAHDTGSNAALPPDTLDLNNNHNTAEPLPVDARGFVRVSGAAVDVGAFEQQPGSVFVVTTLADETYDGGTLAQETADGSGLSLREALGLANQDPTTHDTIVFDPSLIGGSTHGVNDGVLLLTNGQLTINGNVTIEGDVNSDSTPDITIDGQSNSRDLAIKGGNVSIDGLTITGGQAFVHGGGVSLGYGGYAPANVFISHSVIANNQAAFGGGISVDYGDALSLSNSVISGNYGYLVGGGIANKGTLALRDTTVSGNSSGDIGGGIANYYTGALTVVNSTISNNQITILADSAGAGLYNAGSAALVNTTISGNKGAYAGGGVYNSGDLQLTNLTIANNSAYNGGGLYNAACSCDNTTANDTTFTGNYAKQFGGGIDNANGMVTLTNTILAGNRAGYQGSDIQNGLGATSYSGVNLFSQTGVGRPGTDIVQPDLTQVFADLTTIDPDGVPSSGDEFLAGTLANNGGPVQTVAIKVGGDAQNTGSIADLPPDSFDLNNNFNTVEPLPVDARGEPRVFGAGLDIGAFEAQAPVLDNVPTSAAYTEQAAPVELSPAFGNPNALTVTDPGVPPGQSVIASAVVTVSTGAVAGDVLSANTAGTAITASYDSTTETLTLTGSDTLADYSQVLDSVSFSSTSDNPDNFGSNPTRIVTWSVTDVSGATSAPGTTTVSITAVNDPPTLSNLPSIVQFSEETLLVLAPGETFQFPGVSVTDPDSLTLASATVAITGGTFAGDHDLLSDGLLSFPSISVSYNSSTETLTFTGTDTLTDYQIAINNVVFSAGENPTNFGANSTRTVVWTLNDGGGTANGGAEISTVTQIINVSNVNDPPALDNVATNAFFTEESGPVILSSAVSISDPDDLFLLSATVKITGGTFAGDSDVLAATAVGNITTNYNSVTETLTLSGLDTLTHYQSALDLVTFNAGENPTNYGSNPTRTITWQVMDPSGNNDANTPVTETVSITNVNDPPTLSNVATLANVGFTGQTITVSPALSVSDPDNLTLASATVRITGGTFAGDGDVLAATTTGTSISASYNSTTETLTLSGTDTLAHYRAVLDSVTFDSTSANPTNGGLNLSRTLTWTANDGSAASTAATTTISFQTVVKNDFDGNGKSDLLLQNLPFSGNPDVMVELLSANGTSIASSATIGTPSGWHVKAAADFNHDNKSDIVFQNNDGLPEVWLMNGTSVTGIGALSNPGSSWHVIATTDFNADGNPDILWQNNDGAAAIWEMNGLANIGSGVLPNPGPSWHVIGAGDFNGDGKADILWQNNDGAAAIWEMNGLSIIGAGVLPNPGSSWHAIGSGDFNGDGKADILWQNNDGLPAIWEMNGLSVIAAGVLGNPGAAWHAIGTGDFNGDGKADILWENGDGTPAIWDMNGMSFLSAAVFPNPGPTWHLQDDGPITPDQMASSSQPPALHLSIPDTANAGLHGANNSFSGLPQASAGDAGTAGLNSSPPSGLPPQLAATWSSLVNSPAEQTFVNHLFLGTD